MIPTLINMVAAFTSVGVVSITRSYLIYYVIHIKLSIHILSTDHWQMKHLCIIALKYIRIIYCLSVNHVICILLLMCRARCCVTLYS